MKWLFFKCREFVKLQLLWVAFVSQAQGWKSWSAAQNPVGTRSREQRWEERGGRRWGWEGTHPVWCAVCSFFSGPGKYLSHPPEPVSTASAQSSEGTALWCFLKLYHCESEFFRDGSPRHSTRSSPAPTATSGPCGSPNSSPARCVPRLIPS